jgi:hypothetical protein
MQLIKWYCEVVIWKRKEVYQRETGLVWEDEPIEAEVVVQRHRRLAKVVVVLDKGVVEVLVVVVEEVADKVVGNFKWR